MASESNVSESAGSDPIRSILKKASSDNVVVEKPRLKSSKKSISFDTDVTMFWAHECAELEVQEAADGETKVGVASSGEMSPCSSSVEVRDGFEVAGEELVKETKSFKLKKALKSKVGGILRRSSRTQVQGGVAELDISGSVESKKSSQFPRRLSEMSASAELPTVKTRSLLPRVHSFESSDLCTSSNKSLQSRIVNFGRHFRHNLHHEPDNALPVLTKVTPLAAAPEKPPQEDSGSDDEQGGTIKRMPKLRHVSSANDQGQIEDDSEPQYHQLFEYVFVVSLQEESKGKLTTKLTYTFPPTSGEFSGKDIALKSIPQFCFPDIDQWKPTKHYKSESYSFVLTDMEGNRRYGYCRRLLPAGTGPRLPEVFCIVSPLGCFSLYENILDQVEERREVSSVAVFNFLKAISANPFPRPGRSVEVKVFGARGSGMEAVTFTRP